MPKVYICEKHNIKKCEPCRLERRRAYEKKRRAANPGRRNASNKAWRQADQEKMREKHRRWRAENPERWRETYYGMKFHGRKLADMFEQQGNLCAICATVLSQEDFATDHDHETGWVRGLLCVSCNAGMGMLHDNPELLLRAIIFILNAREAERQHFKARQ